MAAFRGSTPPGRLVGATSLENFCKDLSEKDSFPPPHTFGHARVLVQKAGKDVGECLLQGFLADEITFFPAIKFRDIKRGRRLWWESHQFVNLRLGNLAPSPLSDVAQATMQVCQ